MTSTGALTAYSGAKTGRSPLDKRVVKEPGSDKDVWWGPVNKPMSPDVSSPAQLLEPAFCGSWPFSNHRDFVMGGECPHAMKSHPQHHLFILPICRSWFAEVSPQPAVPRCFWYSGKTKPHSGFSGASTMTQRLRFHRKVSATDPVMLCGGQTNHDFLN
jgi:hypothetical protein